jgi:hypothetical protein
MVPWGTAIVGDVLSALQIPGSGIFGKFGEKYLKRKQREAAEILIEEVARDRQSRSTLRKAMSIR